MRRPASSSARPQRLDAAAPAPRPGRVAHRSRASGKQVAKSEAMRLRVLEAAVDCLIGDLPGDLSIAAIADRAGISRGGLQYHFATRRDLLCAVMEFINTRRLQQFQDDLAAITPADDPVSSVIDAHWRHLNEPDFRAYQELVLAARSDPGLAEAFAPIYQRFLHAWYDSAERAFAWGYRHPDVARAGNVAHYVLEGMAYGQLVGQLSDVVVSDMLDYAKSIMRAAMRDHPAAD